MKLWRARLVADRLVVVGALGLLISLFMSWSHQLPSPANQPPGAGLVFRGVPADPTAWQVYSAVDVLLALLAAALVAAVVAGGTRARIVLLVAVAVALAFTAHALAVPPTNGATLLNPRAVVPAYLPSTATAGVGETLAIASLGIAGAGLVLGLAAG